MIGLQDHAIRDACNLEEARARFRWNIPADYSIVEDAVGRHRGTPDRPALIAIDPSGTEKTYTFGQLESLSCRMANALRALGVGRGDVVALSLGQQIEMAVGLLAAFRLGAIALPVSRLFATDGLQYRLTHSAAKVLFMDAQDTWKLEGFSGADACSVIHVGPGAPSPAFEELVAKGSESFTADRPSTPDDPILLMYTSGTTGDPKGVVHGARWLISAVGVDYAYNYFREGDLYYSPADWTWVGGIYSPFVCWAHGVPVLAKRAPHRFDPRETLALVEKYGATVGVYTPSVLRSLREIAAPREEFPQLRLRCVLAAAEVVTPDLAEWMRDVLKINFNLGFGQTEAIFTIGTCGAQEPFPLNTLGRAIPGHHVEVIDEDGHIVAPGVVGEMALRLPDPSAPLEFFKNPEATANRFRQGWMRTGDLATADERGNLFFVSRADDVIKTSGYRVGPAEVETKIAQHPAVDNCVVVGVPDARRGQAIKAFVRLRTGHEAGDETAESIRNFVRTRLAAHEYPHQIEFVSEFPTTVTGKVRRVALREAGGP